MAKKKTSYEADSIQVLTDGQHLRLRPSMYIGSVDHDGIYQLFKETFDNALDEYLEGVAHEVSVTISDDVVTVLDDGRGIPVDVHPQTGVSTLQTVLTNLQAGGKFNTKTYAVSAGLHGVGVKAVNYLSEFLEVHVWRSGTCWRQFYNRGVPEADPQKVKRPGSTGTEIRFRPDPEIFGTSVLDREQLRGRLRDVAALCRGLKVTLQVDGCTPEVFDGNGSSLAALLEADGHPTFTHSTDTIEVAVAFTDVDAPEAFRGFVNLSGTQEGGTHVLGLRGAVLGALQGQPGASTVADRDLLTGIRGAVHVKVQNPSFKGQTKDRLMDKAVEQLVSAEMLPRLQRFFEANRALAKTLVERAQRMGKAREQYKKLRAAAAGQTVVRRDARGVLPGKLTEAADCKVKDRELYICEGNSAAGSAIKARNPKTQEVLPLRGKIVNALRVDAATALRNEEVQTMITAIGLTLDPKGHVADTSKVRVGRVLLLCDADPDGQHIATLILGFFWQFARNVVESGLVHVVVSPLFRGTDESGTTYWYADSVNELEKLSGLPSKKLRISRLKGHGEADANEIGYYAMSPKTRRTLRVTGQAQDGRFEALMGSDVGARKVLLGIAED